MDSSILECQFSTLPEFDQNILVYHFLLILLPRPGPNRPAILRQLARLRTHRWELSRQKSDLDRAITHYVEAILLPPTQHFQIVFAFFHLAGLLLSRFSLYRQPDDIKSSVKYFRFLRINFRSLETFDVPLTSGDLLSSLFNALAHKLVSTPGDLVQDLEEMVALIPEFITADILTDHQKQAIEAFGDAVTDTKTLIFRRKDTQRVADRAIQALRETTVINPDLDISFALARCLTARFETTPVMNDYDEAMSIADRIVATHTPGNSLTKTHRGAMLLISVLLVSRLELSSRPEYLEDAIHRLRNIIPCLPDEDRAGLAIALDTFTQRRFQYFGIAGNSGETHPNPNFDRRPGLYVGLTPVPGVVQEYETRSQMQEKMRHLRDVTTAIINGEITDVDAAVERSRKSLPLQQSRDQWSSSSEAELATMFAGLLFHAHRRTTRLDYLNQAIATFRGLRKMSAPTKSRFHVGSLLLWALLTRVRFFPGRHWQDFEEFIQLCPELANDSSMEVFTRFEIPCIWATEARHNMHPSASVAYETAMSLLQETLVFCPTLQTQHLRLTQTFRGGWRLPSDYASYQIKKWSTNPALADKFVDINRRLESVTMSVAQSDDDEIGRSAIGSASGRREDSIGYLVSTQRRLLEERNTLISHIQSLPGFEHFLKSLSFDVLNSAASHGPVIIVNQAQSLFPSHILLLLKDSPPSVISTPSDFHDRANQLQNELLQARKEKAGRRETPQLRGPGEISRLVFCSLPLHAMGPIPSDDGKERYFSDLYIPSYTPTLSALIESRKRGPFSDAVDNFKPSILLVAQPDTLPGAFDEITAIQTTKTSVTTFLSEMATPETVIEGLREHRFAHFVCHGLLETGKPFDASLELHKGNLTLLGIVRSQLPAAEFAFLSACHTAELTEGSIADEGLHLAAAMQYCGFRSVVGTMWAMADTDGADLSKHFYKTIFSDKADKNGVPYHERSARALQIAVKKLQKKRGITLERWVNFVHYGA
ncbi:CHAT domain containing protein [Lactarius tabidus]